MKYLLLLAILGAAVCGPPEDQVHIPIPYNLPFYSGTTPPTQDTSTSTPHPSTTSSSIPSEILITTLLSSGSMEDLDAHLFWAWPMRTVRLSSGRALLTFRTTPLPGIRRPICSTSSLQEASASVLPSATSNTTIAVSLRTTIKPSLPSSTSTPVSRRTNSTSLARATPVFTSPTWPMRSSLAINCPIEK